MSESKEKAESQQLEFLRQITGADSREYERPVAGALTGGKTPEELYREEMEMLARGGADYSGAERIRELFGRLGRVP